MQPYTFRKMRAELASMWMPRSRNLRRISAKAGMLVPFHENNTIPNYEGAIATDEDPTTMKVSTLLSPFLSSGACCIGKVQVP